MGNVCRRIAEYHRPTKGRLLDAGAIDSNAAFFDGPAAGGRSIRDRVGGENRGVEDYRFGFAVQSAQGDPTRSKTGVIRPASHALLGTKCCGRREDAGLFRNRLNLGSSIAGHQTNRRMPNGGLTEPFACQSGIRMKIHHCTNAVESRKTGCLFARSSGTDEPIERLRPYVSLAESDFCLLIDWLAAALRPNIRKVGLPRIVRPRRIPRHRTKATKNRAFHGRNCHATVARPLLYDNPMVLRWVLPSGIASQC
jgi:hypothetical protein